MEQLEVMDHQVKFLELLRDGLMTARRSAPPDDSKFLFGGGMNYQGTDTRLTIYRDGVRYTIPMSAVIVETV